MRTARLVVSAVLAMMATGDPVFAEKRSSWLSQELAGRVAGPPSDCIMLSQVEGPMIIDRRTILYRQGGRRIWRMDLGNTCPSLREDMILTVEPSATRLCRNDRFRPLDRDSRIPGAACRVGRFVPYDRP